MFRGLGFMVLGSGDYVQVLSFWFSAWVWGFGVQGLRLMSAPRLGTAESIAGKMYLNWETK